MQRSLMHLVGDEQGGYEVSSVLLHQREALRVGVGTVFDGVDAVANGGINGCLTVSVRGYFESEVMCGVDGRLDLGVGHGLDLRVITDGEHAAGWHDLDDFGATAAMLSHLFGELFGAVGDGAAPGAAGPGGVDAVARIAVTA